MRKNLAKIMIITGIVCVIGALSLFIYNKIASSNAAKFSAEMVAELQSIAYTDRAEPQNGGTPDETDPGHSGPDRAQDGVMIKGYSFIGYISIPSLRLNLPVMAEWSYDNLNLSPCRYSGAPQTDDFVIAAHNYSSHFGFISSLGLGDTVSFIDIHGKQIDYKVELIDTLSPTAVADMTSGEYDLTLFTCTYSGEARVTVRLNRIEN